MRRRKLRELKDKGAKLDVDSNQADEWPMEEYGPSVGYCGVKVDCHIHLKLFVWHHFSTKISATPRGVYLSLSWVRFLAR